MIDTHAHLDSTFCDISRVVGLKAVILAGSNIENSKNNLLLAKKYSQILPVVGIHPQEINDDINLLEELVKNPDSIAIGECGLEFVGEVDKERQEIYFRKQVELAQKYRKPLIIHARKAVDEVIEIMAEYKNLSGVFHCYSGGKKRIKKILDLLGEWYFGFDGNLTYEVGLEEVVKIIPRERILAETDSPLLTPEPFRGQENRPVYVKYVYQKIADIWGESFEKTEEIIDANAKRLFKI
ncbi:MAG: TatD family hydrolase [Candidatus Shapirobacteria bacterium]|nr:TatD family hydrolase [Candidatus Shapirobacteria bacterium]